MWYNSEPMNAEIRLIVTDMDGTLLDGAFRAPDSTREALTQAFEAVSSKGSSRCS